MNESLMFALMFVLAGLAGMLLGCFFFGGLWWTVRKGVASKQLALWFLGSRLLRMAVTLVGFYLVGRGDWRRWIVCLLGFIIARFIVMRLTRTPIEHSHSAAKEAGHAP